MVPDVQQVAKPVTDKSNNILYLHMCNSSFNLAKMLQIQTKILLKYLKILSLKHLYHSPCSEAVKTLCDTTVKKCLQVFITLLLVANKQSKMATVLIVLFEALIPKRK